MTVDLRAIVAADIGTVISGDVGSNHISDRSGLQMFSGRLQVDGIVTPARGAPISFLVASPQYGQLTRFPHPLRVIRAVAYPMDNRSEIEVGCRLTLMKDRKDQLQYFATQYTPAWYSRLSAADKALVAVPIYAQKVLEFCLQKIGLTLAPRSRPLQFSFLRSSIDLSGGYLQVIGDLLRSECCYGRLLPDERFEVVPFNLLSGGKGPVLTSNNLVSIEPIITGGEPADKYIVRYSAAERAI